MDTNMCCQLTSNETYFSGRWFSVVITAEEAMDQGVGFYGPVNIIQKIFCLSKL